MFSENCHLLRKSRYVICYRPANDYNGCRRRRRFWIKPLFRDWKSDGFDLERSHLSDDQRLDHLLPGIATAVLWLIHLGDWAIVIGREAWLVANHRRDYSVFRPGRDYARRSQISVWDLPIRFHRNPEAGFLTPLQTRVCLTIPAVTSAPEGTHSQTGSLSPLEAEFNFTPACLSPAWCKVSRTSSLICSSAAQVATSSSVQVGLVLSLLSF